MKAISLWQPWASLWCSPAKVHETRHWPTRHRGPLLVHAAKRPIDDTDDEVHTICVKLFGAGYRAELPRGALLGVVRIITCRPTQPGWIGMGAPPGAAKDGAANEDDRACGDWSDGRFAWRRDHFRLFDPPIPWRGSQGFFDVPDAVVP